MSPALIVTSLSYPFRQLAAKLITNCVKAGLTLRPYAGIRHLDEQNKDWRRSRTTDQVNAEVSKLEKEGCTYLAASLLRVGPQPTAPHITNDVGGFSWHNWSEALDVAIFQEDGSPITDGSQPEYTLFGSIAKELGLTWGGDFTTFKDYDHVQLRAGNPTDHYSLLEIDENFSSTNAHQEHKNERIY